MFFIFILKYVYVGGRERVLKFIRTSAEIRNLIFPVFPFPHVQAASGTSKGSGQKRKWLQHKSILLNSSIDLALALILLDLGVFQTNSVS